MLRGPLVPDDRLRRVTGYTAADAVSKPEHLLSADIALLGRLAIPLRSLGGVIRGDLAFVIHLCEGALRSNVALVGERPPKPQSFDVVLLVVSCEDAWNVAPLGG